MGEKKSKTTIKDVAKAAEVSVATVSYVLNNTPGQSISDKTRKKVLQFANLLGYQCNMIAKNLATGKSHTVAAVIKDINPFASQYYLSLLTELSRLLSRDGYSLIIVDYLEGQKANPACDAYITLGLSEADFRVFADTKYVPVVAVDSVINDFLFYFINDDFQAAVRDAATEFGCPQNEITLLTFGLPQEVLAMANSAFKRAIVIKTLQDVAALDENEHYVTVSSSIYNNAELAVPTKYISSSCALKASAAFDALKKAIDRLPCAKDGHDIRV